MRAAIAMLLSILGLIGGREGPGSVATPRSSDAEARLSMTPAIACRAIRGYEDYDALARPEVTRDEKLLLYLRPQHYTIETVGDRYRVHLSEDVRIRRQGQKRVLWSRARIVEYRAETQERPERLYLGTVLGLKGFPPGAYVAELTLHDRLAEGAQTTQSVEFRIIATPARAAAGSPGG